MRDDQVRRYARHLRLADVGEVGQTTLLAATARLVLREPAPDAELVAGTYLAAGGVGTLAVPNSTEAQRTALAGHGPDTEVVAEAAGRAVALSPRPEWWPAAAGDDTALAFWRGSIAAARWIIETVRR